MRFAVERILKDGVALTVIALLAACGGGGGGSVVSTPTPVAPPPPPPPPPPFSRFNTDEFQASNAAVRAQALTAYDTGATGTGIIAGVIDSGVNPSLAEFTGKIHPNSADLVSTRGITDQGGHGTAVSSVLLGAKNDIGTHGVAFGATLLVLKTDSVGSCTNPDPDAGCSHADNNIARGVDLARTTGAKVINMSLGGSPANANLRAAIDRATAAGIIVVISAGNDRDTDAALGANPDSLAQIARDPVARGLVIIAGAIDSNGTIAAFSNLAGNSVPHYLTALGRRVTSVDENGTQFLYSGTSFAAPVISGAVALVAQAFPTLTPAQIVDLLFRTATDLGDPGDDTTYGQGELNLARAFAPQGSTALAGSATPVSLVSNGTLSSAMGDAGQTGAQAIILDSYGRAFNLDLAGTIGQAQTDRQLSPSLALGTRSMLAQGGATGIALSIGDRLDRSAVERLMLAPQDRTAARALAGSIITRLARNTRLAIGVGHSGAGLLDDVALRQGAAFIAADRAADDWGFFRRTETALAVAHKVQGFDLLVAAEKGNARVWDQGLESVFRPGYRGFVFQQMSVGISRKIGPVALGARLTMLDEAGTALGGRFASLIGNGARSWFIDGDARLALGTDWNVGGSWRQGWTRMAAAGVRQSTDMFQTNSWSFDIAKQQLFTPRDSLSFRISQPLRVAKGGFDLTLPNGYDYSSGTTSYVTTRLNLAPSGREIDLEAAYGLPLAQGFLDANLFWRSEPGHIAAAPNDVGVAFRFRSAF